MVLLSLVRSNQQGRIGYLKEANRVCVALSRAKEGKQVQYMRLANESAGPQQIHYLRLANRVCVALSRAKEGKQVHYMRLANRVCLSSAVRRKVSIATT